MSFGVGPFLMFLPSSKFPSFLLRILSLIVRMAYTAAAQPMEPAKKPMIRPMMKAVYLSIVYSFAMGGFIVRRLRTSSGWLAFLTTMHCLVSSTSPSAVWRRIPKKSTPSLYFFLIFLFVMFNRSSTQSPTEDPPPFQRTAWCWFRR